MEKWSMTCFLNIGVLENGDVQGWNLCQKAWSICGLLGKHIWVVVKTFANSKFKLLEGF